MNINEYISSLLEDAAELLLIDESTNTLDENIVEDIKKDIEKKARIQGYKKILEEERNRKKNTENFLTNNGFKVENKDSFGYNGHISSNGKKYNIRVDNRYNSIGVDRNNQNNPLILLGRTFGSSDLSDKDRKKLLEYNIHQVNLHSRISNDKKINQKLS